MGRNPLLAQKRSDQQLSEQSRLLQHVNLRPSLGQDGGAQHNRKPTCSDHYALPFVQSRILIPLEVINQGRAVRLGRPCWYG